MALAGERVKEEKEYVYESVVKVKVTAFARHKKQWTLFDR